MGLNKLSFPNARYAKIRSRLAVLVYHDWKQKKNEIEDAFINSEIAMVVFAQQFERFKGNCSRDYAYRLRNTLYALWQAPKE